MDLEAPAACWAHQWAGGFSQRKEAWSTIRLPGPVGAPQCVGAADLQTQKFRCTHKLATAPFSFPTACQVVVIVLHLFLLCALSARWHTRPRNKDERFCHIVKSSGGGRSSRAPLLAPMSDLFPPACYDSNSHILPTHPMGRGVEKQRGRKV